MGCKTLVVKTLVLVVVGKVVDIFVERAGLCLLVNLGVD